MWPVVPARLLCSHLGQWQANLRILEVTEIPDRTVFRMTADLEYKPILSLPPTALRQRDSPHLGGAVTVRIGQSINSPSAP
jgi:hypothetical protein